MDDGNGGDGQLAGGRMCREALRAARGAERLVALLDHATGRVRASAMYGIWSLSEGYTDAQYDVLDAGGLDKIVALLADPDPAVQSNAAGAMGALVVNHGAVQ